MFQQVILLLQMATLQSRGNTRARIPARIHDMFPIMVVRLIQQRLDPRLGEAPRARVERLLLAPDDVLSVGVGIEVVTQLGPGEGVQLLDARDGDVVDLLVEAVLLQRGVHLSGANNNALDRGRRGDGVIRDDPAEMRVAGELVDRGAGEGMAEEGFGKENTKGWHELLVRAVEGGRR